MIVSRYIADDNRVLFVCQRLIRERRLRISPPAATCRPPFSRSHPLHVATLPSLTEPSYTNLAATVGAGRHRSDPSRRQPLFFVFGRAGIHRTETNARSRSCSRTSGGRTYGRDFWPLNADDSLIALAPRRWGTESPVVLHGQSPSQLSPGPQQIVDLGPDGRCQAVPVCDQLVECRTLPAHFRPGFSHHVVTTLRADNCGTRASGAIPATSTSRSIKCLLIIICYVHDGRG